MALGTMVVSNLAGLIGRARLDGCIKRTHQTGHKRKNVGSGDTTSVPGLPQFSWEGKMRAMGAMSKNVSTRVLRADAEIPLRTAVEFGYGGSDHYLGTSIE
jgi:hypothetical protein